LIVLYEVENGLSQKKVVVNTDFSEVFNTKGFLEANKSQKVDKQNKIYLWNFIKLIKL